MGIALVIALVVISLGVHEAAHGWMALKCGDPTARDLGRISLNPIVHIDPFMTILLPVFLYLTMGMPFGGAKPVPVAFHNLRHPVRDMALVALAGPVSNLFLAALFLLAQQIVVYKLHLWDPNTLGDHVLALTVYVNLALATFNMIPIPPLDGSRVMTWLMPREFREPYNRIGSFGIMLVFAAVYLVPGFWVFVQEGILLLYRVIRTVVTLGGLW